jgi:CcmD family protein
VVLKNSTTFTADFKVKIRPKMNKIAYLTSIFLFLALTVSGQSNSPDFMRSIGKIYVVVAVIIAIFIGIVLFLIYLDRKLTKLENQIKDNE